MKVFLKFDLSLLLWNVSEIALIEEIIMIHHVRELIKRLTAAGNKIIKISFIKQQKLNEF